MLTIRSLRCRFLACVTAGSLCLITAGNTPGAECGCTTNSCDVCPTACDCNYDFASGKKKKHNCLYKALDAFAGGIEKLLCLDRCDGGCKKSTCDDGCDAAMVGELMLPITPQELHHGRHAPVRPFVPAPYSGPTQDLQLTPTGPSQWKGAGQAVIDPPKSEMRKTQQHMESLDSGQHLGGDTLAQPAAVPPPVDVLEPDMEIRRQPDQQSTPKSEGGSLFESLSDPFRDDQTRTRTYQPVRPSSYDDVELRPIPRRPLSRSYTESSRRANRDR